MTATIVLTLSWCLGATGVLFALLASRALADVGQADSSERGSRASRISAWCMLAAVILNIAGAVRFADQSVQIYDGNSRSSSCNR